MSDCCSGKKSRVALLASVAVNIFLVAFTLGRVSGHPMPPMGMGSHGMFPPGMHEGPPPMFGPDALFGPDEMRADETRMHESFDKMDALRKDFASQLKAGPVSKELVLKHFADIDQVMGGLQKEAQEKAAEKISSMSDEDRLKFAQSLEAPRQGPRSSADREPEGRASFDAPPPEDQRPPAKDSINR